MLPFKTKRLFLLVGGLISLLLGCLVLFAVPSYLKLLGGPFVLLGGVLTSEGMIRFWFNKVTSSQEGLKRLEKMLKSARSEVLITSGSLNSKAYVEYGKIKEIIKEKVEKNVKFHILCGPKIDPVTKQEFLQFSNRPNFVVYQAEQDPIPHGLLVDGQKLRFEDPHLPEEQISNYYFTISLFSKLWFHRLVDHYERNATRLDFQAL